MSRINGHVSGPAIRHIQDALPHLFLRSIIEIGPSQIHVVYEIPRKECPAFAKEETDAPLRVPRRVQDLKPFLTQMQGLSPIQIYIRPLTIPVCIQPVDIDRTAKRLPELLRRPGMIAVMVGQKDPCRVQSSLCDILRKHLRPVSRIDDKAAAALRIADHIPVGLEDATDESFDLHIALQWYQYTAKAGPKATKNAKTDNT